MEIEYLLGGIDMSPGKTSKPRSCAKYCYEMIWDLETKIISINDEAQNNTSFICSGPKVDQVDQIRKV